VPERRGRLPRGILVLFFASGAVGLVYQVLWLRQLTLIFGATAYASSAVLSTFMAGLALGSFAAGRRADRWEDPPLRTYGKLELAITAYAAVIPWLLTRVTPLLQTAWNLGADRHFVLLALVKFIAIAILILPTTTFMGATLPVLSRIAAQHSRSLGSGVGALYAVNTLGAVAGTIAAAFVALPALGMKRALLANLALNAVIGGVAWVLGGRRAPAGRRADEDEAAAGSHRKGSRALLLVFAASGFAAMVLEVAWTRSLALVLGSSVYAYASMLTAFLLGLALGAGAAAAYLRRERRPDSRVVLALGLGAAGLLSFAAAHAIQRLPWLFGQIYFRLQPSPEGWWLAQVGLALLVMFPTTFVLGWVFPLGLDALGGGRERAAAAVGRVYAANTIGTILGAACGGFVLIPVFGVGSTLVGVAAGQLLLGAVVLAASGPSRSPRVAAGALACAALAAVCVLARPSWDVLMMNSGVYMNVQNVEPEKGWKEFQRQVRTNNQLVFARDGLTSSILVAWQPESDNMYLAVNGKTDASSREDLETQILLGHLPLLLHPAPRDIAIIGLASGITAASAATHPVEHIRVVEVEAAMIEAARRFGPYNGNVLDDPRVTVSINDARNELQFNSAQYDVIISEPSNPWMTVASNLFTEDFFRVGRARLRPGGVFGQWIQNYCLTPSSLRSILAGFDRVYPHVLVFASRSGVDLLVVGSDRELTLDLAEWDRRTSNLWIHADLSRAGFRDSFDLAALLQTGGTAIREIVGASTVNTDDNGLVEFAAPKALYLDTQDENLALLLGTAPDALEPIRSLLRTSENPDNLRFEMFRRWLRWDQKGRARKAAELLGDPGLRSEAEALLTAAK